MNCFCNPNEYLDPPLADLFLKRSEKETTIFSSLFHEDAKIFIVSYVINTTDYA